MSRLFSLILAVFMFVTMVYPSLASQDQTQFDQMLKKKQEPSKIAEKALSSVVILVMSVKDVSGVEKPISIGSGFFVREDVIATCLHVIQNADSGYIKIVRKDVKYDISGIVGVDEKNDLALLSIKNVKAKPLPIGNSDKIGIGEEIYAIGNPIGIYEGVFSLGISNGVQKTESGYRLQITAPISQGCSGGPVLNTDGEIIGIISNTDQRGQNLNFAIQSSYLSSLLSSMKPITPLFKAKKVDKAMSNKPSERTEAQKQYDLGISYIKSDLYEDGLKTLNQVAFLYPESDVADDAIYELALIREQVAEGRIILGEKKSLEAMNNKLSELTGSNTRFGIIADTLVIVNALLLGNAKLKEAKLQAVIQYLLAMDYLITLTQRYPDSDRSVEALLSGDRILRKIDVIVYNRPPKQVDNTMEPPLPTLPKGCIGAMLILSVIVAIGMVAGLSR